MLGPHVQKGHYDLTGPNGEIILPQVWDKVIEPDWSITMTMWPMPEKPPPPPGPRNPAPPPTNGHRSQKVHVPPPPGGFKRAPSGATPGIDVVNVAPHKHKSKKKDETLFKFFAGAPSKKKK